MANDAETIALSREVGEKRSTAEANAHGWVARRYLLSGFRMEVRRRSMEFVAIRKSGGGCSTTHQLDFFRREKVRREKFGGETA